MVDVEQKALSFCLVIGDGFTTNIHMNYESFVSHIALSASAMFSNLCDATKKKHLPKNRFQQSSEDPAGFIDPGKGRKRSANPNGFMPKGRVNISKLCSKRIGRKLNSGGLPAVDKTKKIIFRSRTSSFQLLITFHTRIASPPIRSSWSKLSKNLQQSDKNSQDEKSFSGKKLVYK